MNASALWQTTTVFLYELKKALAGRRWIAPFLLAGAPVLILTLRVLIAGSIGRAPGLFGGEPVIVLRNMFDGMFQAYMLRLGTFFAAVAVFVQLYRREVQERTLHNCFLVPVPRHLILLGKYLAGCVHVAVFFLASTTASYLLFFLAGGASLVSDQFVGGAGMGHLLTYLGLVTLATASYGAVFFFVGTLARNPIIPVLVVFLFESFDSLLPGILQRFSVVHWLGALSPVAEPAVSGQTHPLWGFLSGPAILAVGFLALASYLIRRAQVNYSTD